MPSFSVTMQDIAAQTGVSTMTVSRALRGIGNADTIKRIRLAAQELGYRADPFFPR